MIRIPTAGREPMNGKRIGAVLTAALFLLSGSAFAAEPAQAPGKKLFEAKCSACHSLSRPLGKNKDREGWTATVTRMQKVNGCPVTDEEAKQIIDYLVSERGTDKK